MKKQVLFLTTMLILGGMPLPACALDSVSDLKKAAQDYERQKEGSGLRKPRDLSGGKGDLFSTPQQRVNGKLPMVGTIEKRIDYWMQQVRDQKLDATTRAEKAHKAYDELAPLAQGILSKTTIPDSVYKKMGVSDVFIQEEKEGNDAALDALNAALRELKGYF